MIRVDQDPEVSKSLFLINAMPSESTRLPAPTNVDRFLVLNFHMNEHRSLYWWWQAYSSTSSNFKTLPFPLWPFPTILPQLQLQSQFLSVTRHSINLQQLLDYKTI